MTILQWLSRIETLLELDDLYMVPCADLTIQERMRRIVDVLEIDADNRKLAEASETSA